MTFDDTVVNPLKLNLGHPGVFWSLGLSPEGDGLEFTVDIPDDEMPKIRAPQ